MIRMVRKRIWYIGLFVILGFLVQFLAHGVLEIVYIDLLLSRYEVFGLGLSWDTWVLIHEFLSVIFLALGVMFGYIQGAYWWKRVYGKI